MEQLRQRDGAVQGFVGIWEAPGTGGFGHLRSQLILEMTASPACTWSTFQITHAVLTTTHPVDRQDLEKLEESLRH